MLCAVLEGITKIYMAKKMIQATSAFSPSMKSAGSKKEVG